MLSSVDREIRLGIWKIHILHHAEAREVWGKWLLEELAEHGHQLSPGTLYPALVRMERTGAIERTADAPHARARQGFRITTDGRELLALLRREVTALYEEVVLDRGTRRARPGHPKAKRVLSTRGKSPARARADRSRPRKNTTRNQP